MNDDDLVLILSLEEKPAPLPSADFLWWKAQLQARREAVEKSTRPIALAEWAGLTGTLAAVVIVASGVTCGWVAGAVLSVVLLSAVPVAMWARNGHHSE